MANSIATSKHRSFPNGDNSFGSRPARQFSLREIGLWDIVRRRWMTFLLCLVACWGLAVVYFVLARPKYESKSELLVIRKDPKLAASGVDASRESESAVSEDMLATHMQIVHSQKIVNEALAKGQLFELPSITEQLREDKTAADYVVENLYVTRGGDGQARDAHVLKIAFRHTSAADAKSILEAIVQRYQEFLGEKFADVNKEAAQLIVQSQGELKTQLEKAEEEFRKFRETAPLLWEGEQSTNVHKVEYEQIQNSIAELHLQLSDSRARLQIVEAALARIEERNGSDLERLALIDEKSAERVGIFVTIYQGDSQTAEFQASQPERLEAARSEYEALLALRAKEKTLLQDFGSEHPEVRSTQKQIEIMTAFLGDKWKGLEVTKNQTELLNPRKLVEAYVQLLKNDIVSLEHREAELAKDATRAEEAAKGMVKYEMEGERLREQVTRQQEVYDAIVDRLREINLAKDYGGFINEVISTAEVGEEVWPKLSICIALGTLVGLVFGAAGAGIGELQNRAFRSPEEIQSSLNVPVISHIPQMGGKKDRKLLAEIEQRGAAVNPMVYTFHQPRSREAEMFRSLRTSLFFRTAEAGHKILAITSPHQGDGKSTVTANLAVSIAQADRRVLLVCCDMRRPNIHNFFGVESETGLTDVLAGSAEPWDVVRQTDAENVWLMPSGGLPPNPAELLASAAFREFLDVARSRYDYVLLDCPPVLAVADPCIIAPAADAVMLVLRVTSHSRPAAVRAKQMLDDVEANVLGTIINAWDQSRRSGYNGGGYGDAAYGYGYGYASSPESRRNETPPRRRT